MLHSVLSAGRTGVLALAVLLSATLVTATTSRAQNDDVIGVYASAVVYNNPVYDSMAVIEFPFGVNRSQFEFFRPDSSDSSWYGRVFAQVDLYDSEGWVLDSASTYFSLRVNDQVEAAIEDHMIFDKLIMRVRPGTYSARMTVIDAVSKRKGEFFISAVTVPEPQAGRLELAGLQTAFGISYAGPDYDGPNRRLLRNGYLVIPNPTGTYTDSDSVMFVYGEVYNLA